MRAPILTWKDIVRAHIYVKKGLYTDEKQIWTREAQFLNRVITRKTKRK